MRHAHAAPAGRAAVVPEATTPYPYAVLPGMNLVLTVFPIPLSVEIERVLSVSNKFSNVIHLYVPRM